MIHLFCVTEVFKLIKLSLQKQRR